MSGGYGLWGHLRVWGFGIPPPPGYQFPLLNRPFGRQNVEEKINGNEEGDTGVTEHEFALHHCVVAPV